MELWKCSRDKVKVTSGDFVCDLVVFGGNVVFRLGAIAISALNEGIEEA